MFLWYNTRVYWNRLKISEWVNSICFKTTKFIARLVSRYWMYTSKSSSFWNNNNNNNNDWNEKFIFVHVWKMVSCVCWSVNVKESEFPIQYLGDRSELFQKLNFLRVQMRSVNISRRRIGKPLREFEAFKGDRPWSFYGCHHRLTKAIQTSGRLKRNHIDRNSKIGHKYRHKTFFLLVDSLGKFCESFVSLERATMTSRWISRHDGFHSLGDVSSLSESCRRPQSRMNVQLRWKRRDVLKWNWRHY